MSERRFKVEDLTRFIDGAIENNPECKSILEMTKYRVGILAKAGLGDCELLDKVAGALYYIFDIRPSGVNAPSYEDLYLQVEDLKKKIGCPVKEED